MFMMPFVYYGKTPPYSLCQKSFEKMNKTIDDIIQFEITKKLPDNIDYNTLRVIFERNFHSQNFNINLFIDILDTSMQKCKTDTECSPWIDDIISWYLTFEDLPSDISKKLNLTIDEYIKLCHKHKFYNEFMFQKIINYGKGSYDFLAEYMKPYDILLYFSNNKKFHKFIKEKIPYTGSNCFITIENFEYLMDYFDFSQTNEQKILSFLREFKPSIKLLKKHNIKIPNLDGFYCSDKEYMKELEKYVSKSKKKTSGKTRRKALK